MFCGYPIKKKDKRPVCDCSDCTNFAYMEVYYKNKSGESAWSYLCRKHFKQEKDKKHFWGWGGISE